MNNIKLTWDNKNIINNLFDDKKLIENIKYSLWF